MSPSPSWGSFLCRVARRYFRRLVGPTNTILTALRDNAKKKKKHTGSVRKRKPSPRKDEIYTRWKNLRRKRERLSTLAGISCSGELFTFCGSACSGAAVSPLEIQGGASEEGRRGLESSVTEVNVWVTLANGRLSFFLLVFLFIF